MKKMFFVLCILSILLLLAACDGGEKADLCAELGGHELQVVHDVEGHWQACTREGCKYRTETVAHSGGTATCLTKAKCEACNSPYGDVGNHKMGYVSVGEKGHCYGCLLPQCELYAQMQEEHNGGTLNCVEGAKCEKCGDIYGQLKVHSAYNWVIDETECIRYLVCKKCGAQSKVATGTEPYHTLASNGITCAKCGVNYFEATLEFQLSEDKQSYILYSAYGYNAESIVIPAEYKGLPVTEIGEMAFDSSTVKHVVLPDSIEVIGGGAFSCSDLETIVLGSGIKEIQSDAFCATKIKSFTVPAGVEIIAYTTFSGCDYLEEVIIQDGVKHIEQYAFADCTNLTTLILPNTLENMHYEALKNTPALEYNLHQGLKYLGSATNPYFALAGYAGATQAVIHSNTEFCISHALLNCEEVVSLEIGENVRIIDEWALHGMDALETITVAVGNCNYYVVNNILVDKRIKVPILGCKTSVIPEDGMFSEISLQMFDWNASIETVYIPKGVKAVHMDFNLMSGLKWVVFEKDVERLIISGHYDGCAKEEYHKISCFSVYHCHSKDEWSEVEIVYTININGGIRPIACYHDHATHYFYSETQPEDDGNYWHYVDGVPTPW